MLPDGGNHQIVFAQWLDTLIFHVSTVVLRFVCMLVKNMPRLPPHIPLEQISTAMKLRRADL